MIKDAWISASKKLNFMFDTPISQNCFPKSLRNSRLSSNERHALQCESGLYYHLFLKTII